MKTLHMLATVALVALASTMEAQAQVGKMMPVDEAGQDLTLLEFRQRLLTAAEANDTAFVFSVAAPDVFNGFGLDPGIDQFKAGWNSSLHDEGLRTDLIRALRLGGLWSEADSSFEAPYTFGRFDSRALNAFEHGVILGSNVNVRSAPSRNSEILAQLTYDIVAVPDWMPLQDSAEDDDAWITITLADGRTGYVSEDLIRSPIDFRVTLSYRSGRWQIVGWAAGD